MKFQLLIYRAPWHRFMCLLVLKQETHTHTQSGCTIAAWSYKPATVDLMQNEELCGIGVAINYQAAPIGMKLNFN